MVKEETLRKPGWEPGRHYAAIVLGDGQEWHFPRPRMTQRAKRDEQTGRITFATDVSGLSVPYSQILDEMARDSDAFVSTVIEVTFELLKQNYSVDDSHLPTLFWFDPNSDESRRRFDALSNLCLGLNHAPKAEAPG